MRTRWVGVVQVRHTCLCPSATRGSVWAAPPECNSGFRLGRPARMQVGVPKARAFPGTPSCTRAVAQQPLTLRVGTRPPARTVLVRSPMSRARRNRATSNRGALRFGHEPKCCAGTTDEGALGRRGSGTSLVFLPECNSGFRLGRAARMQLGIPMPLTLRMGTRPPARTVLVRSPMSCARRNRATSNRGALCFGHEPKRASAVACKQCFTPSPAEPAPVRQLIA